MTETSADPRLPGDPDVDRMWIVRAADWIAPRRFVLVLFVVGFLIALSALVQTVSAYSKPPKALFERKSEYRYDSSGSSSKASSTFNDGIRSHPRILSVMAMAGVALCALSMLLMNKRFSLGRLILAIMAVGAFGAIPQGLTIPKGGLASFTVIIPGLNQGDVDSLAVLLAPDAALKTLPTGFRSKLSTLPNAGIMTCEVIGVKYPESVNGLVCELELRRDLNESERNALVDFYEYYVKYLAISAAEARSIPLATKSDSLIGQSHWEPWRKEWLANRK